MKNLLPWIVLTFWIFLECIEAKKSCWYFEGGYPIYFICRSYEDCCGTRCCVRALSIQRLWYFCIPATWHGGLRRPWRHDITPHPHLPHPARPCPHERLPSTALVLQPPTPALRTGVPDTREEVKAASVCGVIDGDHWRPLRFFSFMVTSSRAELTGQGEEGTSTVCLPLLYLHHQPKS
uniref:WW domain binding protein VOPP1 n=1 Tax=Oncorhynchus tshawytscha TaxID=74940 RepID=A0AAZ3NXK1_ONCTS